MNYQLSEIKTLLKRLGIALLCFSLFRVLFFLFNYTSFNEANIWPFILGLRFDLSAVAYLFSPYILLHLLPFEFTQKKGYQSGLRYLFHAINSICIVLSLSDLIYYRFIFRRSTADVIYYFTKSGEGLTMLPRYLYDFWYLVPICLTLIYITNLLYEKTYTTTKPYSLKPMAYVVKTIILLLSIPFIILAGRGGIQGRPLQIIDANLFTTNNMATLVSNTPFSIMNTLGQTSGLPKVMMDAEEAEKYFTLKKEIKPCAKDTKKNLMIIILESFGKEYIGYFNEGKGYTPFLDSLLEKSIVFNESFANGKRSIDAMPSIIAGLPAMMNDPYIYSVYASNKLKTLPGILKKKGYSSAFFHGGNNGTMGFDSFCKIAGYDEYHGRDEYLTDTKNHKAFDGNWGIYDGPFLDYTLDRMNQMKEPFFSTLFTLSSHHPYLIPDEHQHVFPKGTLEIHESIGYADHALKTFFRDASKQDWFKNTLFVITADHTSLTESEKYNSGTGIFAVPIVFYDPQLNESRQIDRPIQHIDIMPSAISYLGIPMTGNFFGSNVFDPNSEAHSSVITYFYGTFLFKKEGYLLEYNGERITSFHNKLQENVTESLEAMTKKELENKLYSYLQVYNNALTENLLGE